ncbi:unnamed protein product [Blepharisma stoltei]|uniref:RING-type domain-containing protein n=1 Tax=Blepharisma stoltei TaxID=1481888 RepID=A0AAU9IR18_9CILI|nr:unnamed protein product [Blepharisma stoltei]
MMKISRLKRPKKPKKEPIKKEPISKDNHQHLHEDISIIDLPSPPVFKNPEKIVEFNNLCVSYDDLPDISHPFEIIDNSLHGPQESKSEGINSNYATFLSEVPFPLNSPKVLEFPPITPLQLDGISRRTDISMLKSYIPKECDFQYLKISYLQARGVGSIYNLITAISVAYYEFLMIPAFAVENNKISYEISQNKNLFQAHRNDSYLSIMNSVRFSLNTSNIDELPKLSENKDLIQNLRFMLSIIGQNYLMSNESKGLFEKSLDEELINEIREAAKAELFEENAIANDLYFKLFSNALCVKIKVYKVTNQGLQKSVHEPNKEKSWPVLNFFMITDPSIRLFILYSRGMVHLDGYSVSTGVYNPIKIENPEKFMYATKRITDCECATKDEEIKTLNISLKLSANMIQSYDKNITSLFNKLKDSNIKLNHREVASDLSKIQQQIDFITNHLKPEVANKLNLSSLEYVKFGHETISKILKDCCYCNKRQGVWKSSCGHYYCSDCIFLLMKPNNFENFECEEECKQIIKLEDLKTFPEYPRLKEEHLKHHRKFECKECHQEKDTNQGYQCQKCQKSICHYCLSKLVIANRMESQGWAIQITCSQCNEKMFVNTEGWMDQCPACMKTRHILEFYEFECKPNQNPHGLLCRMCWTMIFNDVCPIPGCGASASNSARAMILSENKILCRNCGELKMMYIGEKMCESEMCFPCQECQENYFEEKPDICVICSRVMMDKISERGYNWWARIS